MSVVNQLEAESEGKEYDSGICMEELGKKLSKSGVGKGVIPQEDFTGNLDESGFHLLNDDRVKPFIPGGEEDEKAESETEEEPLPQLLQMPKTPIRIGINLYFKNK